MVRQRMITCALLACAFLMSHPVFARDERKPYRCIAKDAVSVLQDGTLNKSVGDVALKLFDKMVIDVTNGHVSFPNAATREEWTVEKTSLNDNDYVLFPSARTPYRAVGSREFGDALHPAACRRQRPAAALHGRNAVVRGDGYVRDREVKARLGCSDALTLNSLANLVEHLGVLDGGRHGPGLVVGDLLDRAAKDLA